MKEKKKRKTYKKRNRLTPIRSHLRCSLNFLTRFNAPTLENARRRKGPDCFSVRTSKHVLESARPYRGLSRKKVRNTACATIWRHKWPKFSRTCFYRFDLQSRR